MPRLSRTARLVRTPIIRSLLILIIFCAIHGGALLSPAPAQAQEATPGTATAESGALAAASVWLRTQQAENGGFPGFSGQIDPGTTADAVLALYAARDVDLETTLALGVAIAYLDQNGADYARTGAGQAANLALAAVAGGRDPHDFAGVDLITLTQAPTTLTIEDPIAGVYGEDFFDHALVMPALAGLPLPVAKTCGANESPESDGCVLLAPAA